MADRPLRAGLTSPAIRCVVSIAILSSGQPHLIPQTAYPNLRSVRNNGQWARLSCVPPGTHLHSDIKTMKRQCDTPFAVCRFPMLRCTRVGLGVGPIYMYSGPDVTPDNRAERKRRGFAIFASHHPHGETEKWGNSRTLISRPAIGTRGPAIAQSINALPITLEAAGWAPSDQTRQNATLLAPAIRLKRLICTTSSVGLEDFSWELLFGEKATRTSLTAVKSTP